MCRDKKKNKILDDIYYRHIYKKRYRGQMYDNKKIQRGMTNQSRKEKKRKDRGEKRGNMIDNKQIKTQQKKGQMEI